MRYLTGLLLLCLNLSVVQAQRVQDRQILQNIYFAADVILEPSGLSTVYVDVLDFAAIYGSAPASSLQITGVHRLNGGDFLYSFDQPAQEGLSPAFYPGNVLQPALGGYLVLFDPETAGIPVHVGVDAIGVDSKGNLLLSFDQDFSAPVGFSSNFAISRNDILAVSADGTSLEGLVFESTGVGDAFGPGGWISYAIPAYLNVDGFAYLPETGEMLFSFDSAGEIDGIAFHAADVLGYNYQGNRRWRLVFDGRFHHPGFTGGNLSAFAAESVIKADLVFGDSLERMWRL